MESLFEDAVTNIVEAKQAGVPSFLIAAETLNVANNNKTFLESIGDTVDSVDKFISLSLLSGANEIYNMPATIGNMMGGEYDVRPMEDVVAELDSDYSQFYEENKFGIDLVGFMASSLLPGTAGVKALKAGQTAIIKGAEVGRFGSNLGRGLQLLAPNNKGLMQRAIREVATNSSTGSLTHGSALKSIAAGAGQGVLEGIAFESAVAISMSNSPILENQDFGDLVSNIAFSSGIFGVVSGAVQATKVNSALKLARNKAAQEAKPWQFIPELEAKSLPFENIANDLETLNQIPPIPKNLDPTRANFLKSAAQDKINTIENRIRTQFLSMSGGDSVVTGTMWDTIKPMSDLDRKGAVIGLMETKRLADTTKVNARIERLKKLADKGKASLDDIEEIAMDTTVSGYMRVWGDDAGKLLFDEPRPLHVTDVIKKGQTLQVSAKSGVRIKGSDKRWKFDLKFNQPTKLKTKKEIAPWRSQDHSAVENSARKAWVASLPRFKPSLKDPLNVHVDDIPMMEKIFFDRLSPQEMAHVTFKGLKKGDHDLSRVDFYQFLMERKLNLANRLARRGLSKDVTGNIVKQDEIAAIVNMRPRALGGELSRGPSPYPLQERDLFAFESFTEDYTKKLIEQGSWSVEKGAVNLYEVPQHLRLAYNTAPFGKTAEGALLNPLAGINNHVIENMAIIQEQQRIYRQGVDTAVASILKEDMSKFMEWQSGFKGVADELANPSGAGAGLLSAASKNYGSLGSYAEYIGNATGQVINKFKSRTTEALEPLLAGVARSQKAAIEWSALNAKVRSMPVEYGLKETGDALEPLILTRWKREAALAAKAGREIPEPPVLPKNVDEVIPINSEEVRKLLGAHIELNAKRTNDLAAIRSAQGQVFNRSPEAFYPIPVDPRDYKYFATVTDESITSGNHTSTLFAQSAEELDGMIRKLKGDQPHLRIRTKKEAEDFYRSTGQWEYEKTLSSNYLDTNAKRLGVSAPTLISTDTDKILKDTLAWHMQRETGLVRETVSARYEPVFEELKLLGREYTAAGTSKFGNLASEEFADSIVKNPYVDYIKTALNVRKTSDYPMLTNINNLADSAFSRMYNKIKAAFHAAKTDDELAAINRILEESGYRGAAYDESMEIFANATPDRGQLNKVVQKANAVLATVVLRWDTLNAVNNAVSANVLLGAETSAVVRAIKAGDQEAVGALSKLLDLRVPGLEQSIKSPGRLIHNAVTKFHKVGRKSDEFNFYKENGFMTRLSDQYRNILDDLAFNPGESVKAWNARVDKINNSLRRAGDTGEVITGNRLAEEFNRFVAADVMKQLTDIAVSAGKMTTKEQLAYINTFVNRTQGNYLAAQRPYLFQGPLGQAVSLFQTYQFNLIQQLLRHVGEGKAKDYMTLLGLQATIHGMNGMPAFNALNTHMIGNASGNQEHRDTYDAVYGIAGKTAGDWLMYGAASNMPGLLHPDLKINLYTRGDINPRHLTILPSDPSQVPIIQATGRFLKNLTTTFATLAEGGDPVTTLLRGLEHNGLSRPLAGLAQTLQGFNNPEYASYSTSKKGNVIAANDLLSLVNVARMAGGKPMDEAIAIDAAYRFKAYALKEQQNRNTLGLAIKSTVQAGKNPTVEQIQEFAQKFVENGGRQKDFNSWFTSLYTSANLSQANAIQQGLKDPFTQKMQELMGHRELRDFTNRPPDYDGVE